MDKKNCKIFIKTIKETISMITELVTYSDEISEYYDWIKFEDIYKKLDNIKC